MDRGSRNASFLGMLGSLLEDGRRAEVMQELPYKKVLIYLLKTNGFFMVL